MNLYENDNNSDEEYDDMYDDDEIDDYESTDFY